MARKRTHRSIRPPSVRIPEVSRRAELSPFSVSPNDSSRARDTTVSGVTTASDEGHYHAGAPRAVRKRRRCERCSRFIPVSGPSVCARCAAAEAIPSPVSSASRDAVARSLAVLAAPSVPQPRPSEIPIPARVWPPKPTAAPRQGPPPANVMPPRAIGPDFVVPRPSQLHPEISVSAMPSRVLRARVRPATAPPTRASRSKRTYAVGMLTIAAATHDRGFDRVGWAARPPVS